ncbi:DUF3325 domain-containing protein [Bordetella genomosp. 4]|uniref:DUF3325 domain-containing protein n=1 Tax=Bordetella genomosp. 4 TaxID=463044 RepID=A0A261UCX8_9BORD|nr:DUF3325 domain-containing protein [Bordetella genomosp. 4]OZI59272.1 hypothetical protein CAL20_06560 [Bordetella genomosp. 4]
MPDSVTLLFAFVLALAGMGWLALAMEAHWKQVYGEAVCSPALARRLRWLGGVSLLGALLLCLAVDHATMAALVWFMTLAAAALVVAFTLSWRARWLAVLLPGIRAELN